MQNMGIFDMNNLPSPQYSIEKPNHLKNSEDNYEEIFYSQLQKFNTKTYYNNAPNKVSKENTQKLAIVV